MKTTLNKFLTIIALCLFLTLACQAASSPEGLWYSEGYGWILEIDGNRKEVYHYTDNSCLESGEALEELASQFKSVQLLTEDELIIGNAVEESYYYFERIDELPQLCSQDSGDDPVAVLEALIAYLGELFPFAEIRGVDWEKLKAEARSQIRINSTDAELRSVISDMLEAFGDSHLRLGYEKNGELATLPHFDSKITVPLLEASGVSGSNRQERYNNWRVSRLVETIYALIDLGAEGAAGGMVMWHRVENTGYLMISDMMGFSNSVTLEGDLDEIDRILDTALTALDGVDEMIVDVSLNGGGRDAVSRAIANRFAANRTFAYSKVLDVEQSAPAQEYFLEPTERPSFYGPVHLLTSDITVSAAEVFTFSMRALPNVRHYGMATHGSISDILYKPLPNGWLLFMSNEIYLDSDGVAWEGIGIQPEVELSVFEQDSFETTHFERILDLAVNMEVEESELFNLSSRSLIGMGEDTLICGLIIEGEGPRDIAIVARGPSLVAHGVSSPVTDTRLQIFNRGLEGIASDGGATELSEEDKVELALLGIFPEDDREAVVMLRGITPGVYHIHANSEGEEMGVGTVEVYDLTEEGEDSALINLSTRSKIDGGETVLICGVMVVGQTPIDVLIRGRGPSMAELGVQSPLEDPHLMLVDFETSEVLAENDDFSDLGTELKTSLLESGFAPDDDLESLILTTLMPGAYTAILSASGGTQNGVGAIDFFRVSE
ncbi:S41 family peptidase [Puniceicoccaceae bacterium K14]|nr:S41 family peptidase [Puniceicoccaceae bacterium K14]